MDAWQTIRTAPRDGSVVLLWSPDAEDEMAFTGFWKDDDDYPDGGAWWERWDDAFPIDADPSHWMSLPARPSGA